VSEPRALVEHFFRHEFGRLVAVLTRFPVCAALRHAGREKGVQWVHNQRGRPMAKNHSTSSNKESRLSIRVDPERKAIIARAAKQHGHTISDFVLENAYQMATELLADEGTIVLSKKQVAHIFEVLDHPPAKSVAAVRKLLTERSILDG
jgi:uncharacterized protein (DUF1778 family)